AHPLTRSPAHPYDLPRMSRFFQLDFEKPVLELEQRIDAAESRLKQELAGAGDPGAPTEPGPEGELSPDPVIAQLKSEIETLRAAHRTRLQGVYADLTPWNTVRVARHPDRPQTRDYISMICRDFVELHGDRRFGDDPAIVTGFGRIGPVKCLV